MSCVVGIELPTGVVIASDSQTTGGGGEVVYESKVYRRGTVLYGFAGDASICDRIRMEVVSPSYDIMQPADEFLYETIVKPTRDFECQDWSIMVGTPTEVWVVSGEGYVSRSKDSFSCIGTGGQAAMGALFTLLMVAEDPVPTDNWARVAVEAACMSNAFCGGEVNVMVNRPLYQ